MNRLLWIFCIITSLLGCQGENQSSQNIENLSQDNQTLVSTTTSGQFSSANSQVCTSTILDHKFITMLNRIRSTSQTCGNTSMPPVEPVTLNCQIKNAAFVHSEDMSEHQSLSHLGSNGLRVGERLINANYAWAIAGENIASGYETLSEVFNAWLNSPSHCETLMNEDFSEAGLAIDINKQVYWTLVLAKSADQ